MYLVEPAWTKDVAGGEHDYESNQIEGRLVGEESVCLDSENESVNQCLSWGSVRDALPLDRGNRPTESCLCLRI